MNVGQAIKDALATKRIENLEKENAALRAENRELIAEVTALGLALASLRASMTTPPIDPPPFLPQP
jgi:uncharacterized protein (UPF0335 family)